MDSDIEINEDIIELRIDEPQLVGPEQTTDSQKEKVCLLAKELELNTNLVKSDIVLHSESTNEKESINTLPGEIRLHKSQTDSVDNFGFADDKKSGVVGVDATDDKSIFAKEKFGSENQKLVFTKEKFKSYNFVSTDIVGFDDDTLASTNQKPASADDNINCSKMNNSNTKHIGNETDDSVLKMNGSSSTAIISDSKSKVPCSLYEIESNLKVIEISREKLRMKGTEMEHKLNDFIDSFIEATEKHRNTLLSQIKEIVRQRDNKLRILADELGRAMKSEAKDEWLSNQCKRQLNTSVSDTSYGIDVDDTLKFVPEIPSTVIGGFQMFGAITDSSLVHDRCFLTGGSECAVINKEVRSLLHVNEVEAIDPMSKQAWVKRKISKSHFLEVRINKIKENQYSLCFIPHRIGLHHLYVQVDGIPVQGSPLTINVMKPNKRRKTEQNNASHGYFVNGSHHPDYKFNEQRWSSIHDRPKPESSINDTNKRKLREVTV